ncbi:hypothetical protein COM89_23135 [Bacillus thuringiensis]|uniref:phage tail spike protein n=1 Tax=Bacillus thuringiensis TaxID=1428 RepID=UPI000BEB48BA|nr:phage tail spike protein [Bacillus thuringiensis]PEB73281.1 hypothetical protein COM89_23135 [Bacillus thuringiensis]
MRTPSGIIHVVDFKTEQIVANIQPKDYWDDVRHWEIKNNIDTLEFKVFDNTEHAATLMQQNLVLKEVRDGRIVPYVITEAEKDSHDRSVIAYASGEWIQLAKAGIIPPQKLEGKTVMEMVNIALVGTKWKTGNIEYTSFRSMNIDEFIDPLSFLKKIASLFELEIQYRAEVVGSQIVGRYVDMVKKRGQETGKEVTLGKDLMGIKRVENSQNICTSLVGFVKKEGDTIITVESINNGLPYIVDNDAFQRWNERGQHKFGFYTPETEEDITPKRLMTLMKTELAKRINSSISYDVQAQSIGRVFGLAHELINEGDTIRIKDTGFTPELYLEARAIAGDESFTNPSQDKYVFGDYREITDPNEEMRKLYNRVLASLGNKANKELLEQLEKLAEEAKGTAEQAQKESKAAKDIAESTQEYIEQNLVDIIESVNPPTAGLKPNKTLWRDISNGKPGILKIWTGTVWELVVPDTGPLQQSIKDVKEDIETAKTELNQKVQGVEGKAQEIAGQIVDVQKQVNNKVDQTWINNQLKDKADKTGVYTKDEIKDGFIGKQIYETDKQGNVQNFKDINTSIGQTNEALKQKAENSELTKTNDGLTKLQNKTNEIETTANGTKQKLSELETTVNNTNVGGRNYVLESDKFISPPSTMQSFRFVNDLKDLQGKQVTLSVYVEIKNAKMGVNPSNRIGFEPSIRYSDNSFQHLGAWLRITDGMNFKGIISTTVSIKDIEVLKTEQNAVYIQCGGDYVKVGRPKIEIGNKVTDWTPAPEDQVTTTDFTKKTVEIETTIKGINTSVSNIQNEQGKLTERVTKSEQTADGFKTSIESLTKKDTEISNKLNTVESTVEGTKKTISAIQSDTTSLKQTTTEIKEEAGKISEKLTSVEKNFNEQEIGVRNLISDTKYWETTQLSSNSAYGVFKNNLNQIFSELAGGIVTFSFDVKITTTDKTAGRVQFYGENGSPKYTFIRQIFTGITDEFQRVTYTTKITELPNNTGQARLEFWGIDAKTTKIIIRNFKLEKGNKATGWTPAPEDQVTTDEFTKKTTDIEKSVDGIKENITMVEQNQTGFDKRVTAVEKNSESISQNVSKLQETQTTQGKQISEAQSTIKQHSDALNLAVKMKDVEDYVGGIGNQTVLRNVLWKNDTKYWQLTSNAARDTQVTYKGCNSLSVITTGNASNLYKGASHDYINAGPGWNYVFSAYFYTDNKASIDAGAAIEIQCYDANNKMIKNYLQEITIAQGTWIRTHVAGLLVEGTKKVKVLFWVRKNGRLWMAQPMLQIGDKPSSFMENPVDIVDKDKIMEEVADKVATEGYTKKVTELERSIAANEEGVTIISGKQESFINETYNAYVKKTESKFQVLDEGILAQILKDGIVTAINMSPGKITINAAKLDINADTVVKWLTAQGIDANVIKISGDVVTIDKSGITVRMANFLYQDEFGKKYSVMPKKNLIADHMFSSISCYLPTNNMRRIKHSPEWKITGEPYIEDNYTNFGYEQMINAMRINVQHWIRYPLFSGVKRGKKYTLSAHFRAATLNGNITSDYPRLRVITGHFAPDGRPVEDLRFEKAYDAPGRSIVRYSNTFTIPDNFPDNGFCYFDIYGAGDYASNMAVCVSGVQLVEGDLPAVYNWDTTIDNIASGYTPVQSLSIGNRDTFLGYGVTSPEFRINTNADVHFNRKISTYGVNVGGQPFGSYGSIFYANGASGWSFYTMGIDGNWKTWNGI